MKIGIVGLRGGGKTTVLSALTGQDMVLSAGKKVSVVTQKVPDERIDVLSAHYKPKKSTYPEVVFSDVAGGLKKSSKDSSGLDPEFVNLMKGMDALVLVIPDFEEYRSSVEGEYSIVSETRTIEAELILSDLGPVEKKLKLMEKSSEKGMERDVLVKCLDWLGDEKPLRTMELNDNELKSISGYRFLSLMPALYLVNVDEDRLDAVPDPELVKLAENNRAAIIIMAARLEMEVAQMPEEEQAGFRDEMGLGAGARERFVKKSWDMLKFVSFYTVGEDEVKAWPIKVGTAAPQAAGKVHTDIERGFIRASVFTFNDFQQYGSEAELKAHGKIRLEGKEYIVQDGDIIEYRFNV